MSHARLGAVVLVLTAQLACGSAEAPTVTTEAPPLADENPAQLAEQAEKKSALVPSPIEMQAALAAAGIDTELGSLVPASRAFRPEADPDRVAVRTGVVLADMLLTVKTSTDAQLTGQLAQLRAAMTTLEGGKDIDATIAELQQRIEAGALGREELVKELDELSTVAIPELEFNGVARIVPLVQAGSWLEGAHLVAEAAKAKGNAAGASPLLKQPAVVAWFAEYAKQVAPGAVPSEVATALDGTLTTLSTIANKTDALTDADVDTIATSTGAVLALL